MGGQIFVNLKWVARFLLGVFLIIWKLKRQCQSDFDNGMSRSSIFEKYSGNGLTEKKLASAVSSIRDAALIRKYRFLNYVVVGIMILLFLTMTFSFYEISRSGEVAATTLVSIIVILFASLIYGILKNYHQAYFIYAILTTMKLPTHIDGFGSDLTTNIIELGLALFLVSSLWFLKIKLFPYMSLSGAPKKNADGKYLVAVNS
ncbi:hypothetical protein ACE02Z_17960 [Shewanella xiamenensis]|uniref:hypothetical protein n=1 Tax=Shewanella xiamenensis TaxID=332186 RepID=UPI00313B705D